MKNIKSSSISLIVGIVLGAIMFGGLTAFAAAGFNATPTTSKIIVDGKEVKVEAYVIEGRNYLQLRDLAAAIGFSVVWDGTNNRVIIDTSKGYDPNEQYTPPASTPSTTPNPAPGASADTGVKYTTGQTVADGSGNISDTPLTLKTVDGKDYSREDFSLQVNPAIFNERFTRGMYNAARQTIVDRDTIIKLNSQHVVAKSGVAWFNPYYSYASAVDPSYDESNKFDAPLSDISAKYGFRISAEPYADGYYNYPGYFIVEVCAADYKLDKTTQDKIESAKSMTVSEKAKLFNDFVRSRITYQQGRAAGIEKVFNGTDAVGACGTYALAFKFLCDSVQLPCILVNGDNHVWNLVYADGCWLICDPTNNRVLVESINFKSADPQRTMIAKELLVPGSTK